MGHDGRLAGRRILITGAASGIGAATARMFRAEGARIALLDFQADKLKAVADETGGDAFPVDLADEAATEAAVIAAAERLGGLDGVVNCAGIAHGGPLEECDPARWARMLAVNLTAPYIICRTALRWMKESPAATIVNVASGQALLPNAPGVSAYAASKAGLAAFTKALGAELGPRIRANVVAPGIVNTPLVSEILSGHDNPDDAPFVRQYAMQRVAAPEEIAAGILFLTSAESSYVTGTILAVDGGRTYH